VGGSVSQLCEFGREGVDIPELQKHLVSCVSTMLGEPLDKNYLVQLGEFVLQVEKKFNDAAGFTKQDDRLPEFFRQEQLQPSGNVFDVPEEELDSVYEF